MISGYCNLPEELAVLLENGFRGNTNISGIYSKIKEIEELNKPIFAKLNIGEMVVLSPCYITNFKGVVVVGAVFGSSLFIASIAEGDNVNIEENKL